jgi:hypothetical protein
MSEQITLSEVSQEFWDYVDKVYEVSSRLKKAKEELRDPDEADMLFLFTAESNSR